MTYGHWPTLIPPRLCDWCEAYTPGDGSACRWCGNPALDKTTLVVCAWTEQHATMTRGKAGCPACKGSGYVETLTDPHAMLLGR